MRVWKRVSAFLCVVLLVANLVLFPLRVRAMSGALTAVGAAVTVSAFLMACGIYPYVSDEGRSFGEWGAESLYDLWVQYVDSFEGGQLPSGGTVETFNQIKSFIVGSTLAIASGTWETLCGFAGWIVDKFTLADNQTGVQLGIASGLLRVPVISNPTRSDMLSSALLLGKRTDWNSANFYLAAKSGNLYAAAISSQSRTVAWAGIQGDVSRYNWKMVDRGSSSSVEDIQSAIQTYNGITYYCSISPDAGLVIPDSALPVYDTLQDFLSAIASGPSFSGITVDSTTVASLQPLPADTEWGGLAVQGTSNPAGAVEQGVTAREKPVVRPIEVEIQQGTEVDAETGEVVENPVVITPEDVVPTVAALSPPDSFLSALQTTMTTKFPFCLPFDLFKILQAFYVAPEAPIFSLSFHDPFSNSDFSITVDLSPWDEVAAVVRNFEAMILLAGFCLNFDKFNVIHLILGGLG